MKMRLNSFFHRGLHHAFAAEIQPVRPFDLVENRVAVFVADVFRHAVVDLPHLVDAVGDTALLVVQLEVDLHLGEAVEPQFLREAHDGRARDAAFLRHRADGHRLTFAAVQRQILPDRPVALAEPRVILIHQFLYVHLYIPRIQSIVPIL